MTSDERELKRQVARRLPSHMEFVVARDRVLNELHAAPPHLQRARLADTPPAPSEPEGRVEGPAVSWLRTALPMAAAAAAVLWLAISGVVGPRSFSPDRDAAATVETADGTLYRLSGSDRNPSSDVVSAGDRLRINERLQTNGGAGAQLILTDGSRVEMRSQSELLLERAIDGMTIRLVRGGVIVNAAKQRNGHLYVQTDDMIVAVVGTVFFVNAADDGSRVAVIEGEVRVQDGKVETTLRPGEQMSSRPTPAAQVRPMIEQIEWSRRKDVYEALLRSAIAVAPTNEQASALPHTSPRPQFEEASIRPCSEENDPLSSPGRGGASSIFQMTPGHYYARCVTVGWMIYSAYPPDAPDTTQERPDGGVAGLGDGKLSPVVNTRVKGGPGWIYEDRYTVEAVADPEASARTLQKAMMWDLLERRLRVKVHQETEQVPAFELVVAPGGFKVKPMSEGDTCATDPSRSRIDSKVSRNPSARARCPIATKAGWVDGGPNYRWEVSIAMGVFVPLIRSTQGDPVFGPQLTNRTGIAGNYLLNFAIEFGPDATTPALLEQCARSRESAPRCSEIPTAPPLATVMERELGIRLQSTTRPRDYVVVDRIERPSPN